MKRLFVTLIMILVAAMSVYAQVSPETLAKRNKRKNLTVKEYNTDAKGKLHWLDHVNVYDDEGRKIEEIEYSTYGQVSRVVTSYDATGRVASEVVYGSGNKPERIRKYEYNEDGTKKKQYNYMPNGKLYSVKEFVYEFSDAKK